MQPLYGQWTVVMVGAWNLRLLGPLWLSQHLFDGQDVTGELPLTPGVPLKFSAQGVELLPSEDRVVLRVQGGTEDPLPVLIAKAEVLLTTLRHTPIRAVGVNIAFRQPADGAATALVQSLTHPDQEALANAGWEATESSVSRRFLHDGATVNFAATTQQDGYVLTFNIHWQVESGDGAVQQLRSAAPQVADISTMVQQVYPEQPEAI